MEQLLVREAVKSVEPVIIDAAERQLAERAYAELSYSVLHYDLQKKVDDAKKTDVAKSFEKLGIEPFSSESVEKYKAKMLRKMNFRGEFLEAIAGNVGMWLFAGSGIGTLLSVLTLALLRENHHHFSSWLFLIPAGMLATAVSTTVIAVNAKRYRKYSWNAVKLYSFNEKVPAFALSRALEVRKELPNSSFFVESLVYRNEIVDPFMFVQIGDEKYYLDVWDEPKFEGRRTV
jgi:hypothetical protein